MTELTKNQILMYADMAACHVCGRKGRHCANPDGLVEDSEGRAGYLREACDDRILCADDGSDGRDTRLICNECYEERADARIEARHEAAKGEEL